MTHRHLFQVPLLSLFIAAPAIAQAPPAAAPGWTGWAQCQLTIQAPGYTHSETHLWKSGGTPTKQGNMEISPMTWTVVGNGSLQRVSGPTTTTAQWTVNGTLPNLTLGATLHLDRITLQRWTNHGPARGALTGTEVSTTNGVPRSRAIILDVQQWAFPGIESGTTSTRAAGSQTLPFDGLRGPNNPPSGATGTAACTWDFARGTSSPSPAPALPTPPPTTTTAPSTPTTTTTSTTPSTSTTPAPSTNTTPAPASNAALVSVSPNSIEQGVALSPALTFSGRGTNWRQGTTTVNLGPGIVLQGTVQVQSPTALTVLASVPYAAAPGPRAITITTGSEVVTLPNALTVVARRQPEIAQVSPNTASVGQQAVTVTLTGAGTRWAQGETVVTAPAGMTVTDQNVTSPTSMTVTFDVDPTAAAGPRDLTVMNPGPVVATDLITKAGAITITPPAAALSVELLRANPNYPNSNSPAWGANGGGEYEMSIINRGPSPADGAMLTFRVSNLEVADVSCRGSFSSDSFNVTPAEILNGFAIPRFRRSQFSCKTFVRVLGPTGTSVTLTVDLRPPSGVSDPDSGNNSASHTQLIK